MLYIFLSINIDKGYNEHNDWEVREHERGNNSRAHTSPITDTGPMVSTRCASCSIFLDAEVQDERRRHGETLYKCIIAHTSQSDWTPDVAVSLWVRANDPGEEWPEWVQPTGASDAYAKGAKVSHNERHWISDVDNNVWEPGVYGWGEAQD